MRSERRVYFVLGSPRSPLACGRRAKTALKKAAGVSGGNDECQVRLKGRERDYWMCTEIGMLGGHGLQGQVMAGFRFRQTRQNGSRIERDNVVYWKETKGKINNDLQCN